MISDPDLCVAAQSGDTQAADLLVRRHARLAHRVADGFYVQGGDRDDLRQEALLGSLYPSDASSVGRARAGSASAGREGVSVTADGGTLPLGQGRHTASGPESGGARRALDLSGIDWVIVGGESGPGARPMHPDWARELRDACLIDRTGERGFDPEDGWPLPTAGRPAFFFKQWGEWQEAHVGNVDAAREQRVLGLDGRDENHVPIDRVSAGAAIMARVGKKAAGRLLDGRTWDEMPGGAR